jgi:hypothetical protein
MCSAKGTYVSFLLSFRNVSLVVVFFSPLIIAQVAGFAWLTHTPSSLQPSHSFEQFNH